MGAQQQQIQNMVEALNGLTAALTSQSHLNQHVNTQSADNVTADHNVLIKKGSVISIQ